MDTEKIKERLNSSEYDFLRTHKSLGNNIILLTTGGSHAYGTDTPESDLDIRGIALNSAEELLTMDYNDKPVEDRSTDTVIYFLKQIINLLLSCNPNTIELLGTKPEHLFICASEDKLLRDYDKLNHRNSKKDELHLNKHAMHLIRLLIMGTEILQGKGVHTYRDKEKDLLLDIRNSKFSYDEIFEMVDKYDEEFKYASDNTLLPDEPDYAEVKRLVAEINRGVLNKRL